MRSRRVGVLIGAAAVLLAACTSGTQPDQQSTAPSSRTPSSSATSSPPSSKPSSKPSSSKPPADPARAAAERVLATMSRGQQVTQLLMTSTSTQGASDAVIGLIRSGQIGSVDLNGRSQLGAGPTKSLTAALQQATSSAAPKLFVATDQEGGEVQELSGAGFASIPSELGQGQQDPAELQTNAKEWARQLRAAGVNLNLAPVMDTVPSPAAAQTNAPIGQLDREFGYTPTVVSEHGEAVVRGELSAGIDVTAKHFPGLGRVQGNTDTSSGVTDSTTTATDPYLAPFSAAIHTGAPFVMMSTAIYTKIDAANPAAFSSRIVTGLLRQKLGFQGVVISDDVGAAAQVAGIAVGQRAVRFVSAGGDVVLTVDPSQIPTMRQSLLAAMATPSFAAKVRSAALRVLTAKARRGLLD